MAVIGGRRLEVYVETLVHGIDKRLLSPKR